MDSTTPPSKRIRLESSPTPPCAAQRPNATAKLAEDDNCSICLQQVVDRTVIPTCSHEFCFECLLVWSEQSRRCPLCSQPFGSHVIHHIRSKHDYQKHYLFPLQTSPRPPQPRNRASGRRAEREWGRRERQKREEADRLDHAIARRRWIYQHHLYAKHIASNSFTRYRPFPTPAQFAAAPDLISRMTSFLRRELRVWVNMDVEFLTTFILSLMKSIDIRSESAIKLLAEFLDMDTTYIEGQRYPNAEHFAHEVYSYLRSPYKDLFIYDTIAQYDVPPDLPAPPQHERSRRWRTHSRSQSRSRSPIPHVLASRHSRSPSRPRLSSWSPSGRQIERQHYHSVLEQQHEDDVPRERSRSRSRNGHGEGKRTKSLQQKDIQAEVSSTRSLDLGFGQNSSHQHQSWGNDGRQQGREGDQLKRDGSNAPHSTLAAEKKGKQKVQGTREEDVRCTSTASTPAPDYEASQVEYSSKPAVVLSTKDSDFHDTQSTQERKQHRPPRNKSLRDSVRAHLAPRPHSRPNAKGDRKQERQSRANVGYSGNSKHHCETTDTAAPSARTTEIPSLLTRLSDRSGAVRESPGISPAGSPSDTNNISRAPGDPDNGPEIMARTRARHAKLKNDIEANENAKVQTDAAVFPQIPGLIDRGGKTNHAVQAEASESGAMSARLLIRLEDAKRKLPDTPGERDDGSSHASPSLLSRISSATTDVYERNTQTQVEEADLRRRAQLRARLATEKKKMKGKP